MSGDDEIIDETTLFEIAAKVYWYSQWRYKDGFPQQKSEYIKLRNELVEKLRAEYPQMTDTKFFNFLKIYLFFNEDPNTKCDKSEFLFDGEVQVNRVSWMGPYLQKAGDWKYWQLVENMGLNIHHP